MKLWILCACMLYFPSGVITPYDGNNMLTLLGQSSTSQTFKDFAKFWLLDKALENRAQGIKIYVNPINDKVESITLTGEVVDLSEIKFVKYAGKLPLEISLDDDTSALNSKLGHGEKLMGRTTLRFHTGNLTVDATYSNLKTGKITYLSFSNASGKPLVVADVVATAKTQSRDDKRAQLEKATFLSNNPAPKTTPFEIANLTPFKRAILDVFKASRESTFAGIKQAPRTAGNFWNYKYTYNTSLKIPGEKYNMLYSYPFVTSQLDFVSVLKESDSYDRSFEVMYRDYEKQLTVNFPASEGWIATCLPGKNKTELPDLEFRNDKFGAVILDHSKNPAGRHILYLRFLLFAD